MNIIVTGGAGFIGSNFVFHMLKKYPDYRIICLDKLTYAGNLSTLVPVMDNPNFRFVKADICDREAVDKLFEEEHPDIVVNFAAESHVDRSIEDPGIFLQTNIIGTSVLMDAWLIIISVLKKRALTGWFLQHSMFLFMLRRASINRCLNTRLNISQALRFMI